MRDKQFLDLLNNDFSLLAIYIKIIQLNQNNTFFMSIRGITTIRIQDKTQLVTLCLF